MAAVRDGARAVESDVWLTADGVPVLAHDGVQWSGLFRRHIRTLTAADLPPWLPRLDDLYAAIGPDLPVSLDLKDPDAADAVLVSAGKAGAVRNLWLCASVPVLRRCRALSSEVRLANSTTLRGTPAAPHARLLAEVRIDALNLRSPEWTPARVEIVHAAGVLAFAWDVQDRARLDRILRAGCDAVYSDHVDLLLAALAPGEVG